MDVLDFRQLVRSVIGRGVARDYQTLELSYAYALATPKQQAACVREVLMDWSRKVQKEKTKC